MAEPDDNGQSQETRKDGTPSIHKTAFACPHCDAYTHQDWYYTFAALYDDQKTPFIPLPDSAEQLEKDAQNPQVDNRSLLVFVNRYLSREVFLFSESEGGQSSSYHMREAGNLSLSKCFTCKKVSVWIHERLVWPPHRTGPEPNGDLPPHIKADYQEARSILELSPRGAAALLRLCVEQLCIHLKAEGSTLDNRIAGLVKKGLHQIVQQSLDAVRVIGNEAVHPGQIDLKDDRDTAETLFRLVNLIAEKMISEPAHVQAVYNRLPASKRQAIEERDNSTSKKS